MENKTTAEVPTTIDAYMQQVPGVQRQTLEKVRKAIKAAAPEATELISYQIPTFKMEYAIVAFAAFKNHCSFFTLSNEVMKKFKDELSPYYSKGITVHFPVDKPLPATLIKKIVQFRLVEDAARAAARDAKKKKKK